MNKTELVTTVADATGKTKTDVAAIISATLAAVQTAVASGDRVVVPGFGSFERRPRKGGERRTPQGATVTVADTHVPAFKAGDPFKRAVSAA